MCAVSMATTTCIYENSVHDVAELKQPLVKVWADFEQTIVDRAIDQ